MCVFLDTNLVDGSRWQAYFQTQGNVFRGVTAFTCPPMTFQETAGPTTRNAF